LPDGYRPARGFCNGCGFYWRDHLCPRHVFAAIDRADPMLTRLIWQFLNAAEYHISY
jgi:hypothetical protein